jgi:hypothetical protein
MVLIEVAAKPFSAKRLSAVSRIFVLVSSEAKYHLLFSFKRSF